MIFKINDRCFQKLYSLLIKILIKNHKERETSKFKTVLPLYVVISFQLLSYLLLFDAYRSLAR